MVTEHPADLTVELLRQIRAEQTLPRESLELKLGVVDHRMDRLETDMREVKQTLRGLTYMMATFTGRLEDLETRVDRLRPS